MECNVMKRYIVKKIVTCSVFLGLSFFCLSALTKLKTRGQEQGVELTTPLFRAYPKLAPKIYYTSLGDFPTPITCTKTLGSLVGTKNLYVKRDDLSGKKQPDQTRLMGGGKLRKLEFLLGDAAHYKVDTIVTIDRAEAYHSLLTGIYAQQLGMKCIALLSAQNPTSALRRNLLLCHHYGITLKHYSTQAERNAEVLVTTRACIKNSVLSYFIPFAGTDEFGMLGFVNAAFELKEQIQAGLMPEPDYIYIPTGSAGSAAGLIVGLKAAGLKSKVVAVRISDKPEKVTEWVGEFSTVINNYLYNKNINFPKITLMSDDFEIIHNCAGNIVADITPDAAQAIELMAQTEKIKLDGTYTGKALVALLQDLKKPGMQDKVILLWDTFCPDACNDIIAKTDYKMLPEDLQCYFTCPLSILDNGA